MLGNMKPQRVEALCAARRVGIMKPERVKTLQGEGELGIEISKYFISAFMVIPSFSVNTEAL